MATETIAENLPSASNHHNQYYAGLPLINRWHLALQTTNVPGKRDPGASQRAQVPLQGFAGESQIQPRSLGRGRNQEAEGGGSGGGRRRGELEGSSRRAPSPELAREGRVDCTGGALRHVHGQCEHEQERGGGGGELFGLFEGLFGSFEGNSFKKHFGSLEGFFGSFV